MGETFFGYKNGFGVEFNPETGKIIYKGTFEFDKFSGKDCELFTEGRLLYAGGFRGGLPDGYGVMYADGENSVYYRGEWWDGEP